MSLTSSLQRIVQAKADIKTAIEAKGVTVGDDVSIADYDYYIAAIQTGGGSSDTQSKTVALNMENGDQIILPDSGYTLSQVTVQKPATLVASNIVSGVTIGGVTGTAATASTDPDQIINGTITSISSGVTTMRGSIFSGCSQLASASFPNVTDIATSSFQNTALTNISNSFPSATSIGANAFYNCTALTQTSFPNVTSIGNSAFRYCSVLSVYNFDKVTTIGDYAFDSCNNITSISFPKVQTVGQYAFQGTRPSSVSLPEALTLKASAFRGISSTLRTIDLPKCTTLEGYVFYGCSLVNSISAPKLTSIGNYAFYNCKPTSLTLENTSVVTLSGTSQFHSSVRVTIYVPSNLVETYKTASNWSTLYNNGRVQFAAIPE